MTVKILCENGLKAYNAIVDSYGRLVQFGKERKGDKSDIDKLVKDKRTVDYTTNNKDLLAAELKKIYEVLKENLPSIRTMFSGPASSPCPITKRISDKDTVIEKLNEDNAQLQTQNIKNQTELDKLREYLNQ